MKTRGLVRKAAGTSAPFSKNKFRKSLRRAGASLSQIRNIEAQLFPKPLASVSSLDIYRQALGALKRISSSKASKYKLKRALMELGPSGYHFEKLVGILFGKMGYRYKVGVILQGKCVQHEVDVVAENESAHCLVECKFRNKPGYKSDVKVPLYIHARFNDIINKPKPGLASRFQGWVVTNAAFTADAIQYGKCVHLNLIGWNYPQEGNLQQLIERYKIFPITCLLNLPKKSQQALLKEGVISCEELISNWQKLKEMGFSISHSVLKEARALMASEN